MPVGLSYVGKLLFKFLVILKSGCFRFAADLRESLYVLRHTWFSLTLWASYLSTFWIVQFAAQGFKIWWQFDLVLMSLVLLLHDLGNHYITQYYRDLLPLFLLSIFFFLVLFVCLTQGFAMQPRLASTHWRISCLCFPSAGVTTIIWMFSKALYFTFKFLIHFELTLKKQFILSWITCMCG